jgi:hypothetical protein
MKKKAIYKTELIDILSKTNLTSEEITKLYKEILSCTSKYLEQ